MDNQDNQDEPVALTDIEPSILPLPGNEMGAYNISFESSVEFSDALSPQLSVPSLGDSTAIPAMSNAATGQLPSREEFTGPFGFSLLMDSNKKTSRSSWEYSLQLNKLYVKLGCLVPIQFCVTPNTDVKDMKVRALLVFDYPDDQPLAVERCPLHCQVTHKTNQDHPNVQHVVSCKDHNARYEVDLFSGRHSVVVPLTDPQPGTLSVTQLYAWMCKSSCEGGINRRNTSIIFTLEKNFQVLGRQVVKVRVCSCPKRDMLNEQAQLNEDNAADGQPRGKKRKMTDKKTIVKKEFKEENLQSEPLQPLDFLQRREESLFYLEVRSKKHYRQLLQRAFELYQLRSNHTMTMYKNLLQQVQD